MMTDVLGIGFDDLTMEEAVNKGLEFAEKGSSIVVTPNPEIVYISRKDRQLKDILDVYKRQACRRKLRKNILLK